MGQVYHQMGKPTNTTLYSDILASLALMGTVEMDEMYLGGREANKHQDKHVEGTQGRSTKTKPPIFGMYRQKYSTLSVPFPFCQS